MANQKSLELQEVFKRIDMIKSYEGIFSSLWYGASPCGGIQGITTTGKYLPDFEYAQLNSLDRSFLKFCSWKGIPIECAAIFKTIPTDSGVCCAFNMKSAEEIYRGKMYTNIVKTLQEYETNYSASDTTLPNWYTSFGEPNSFAGRKKGLFVMLDGHSDLLANTSLQLDYLSIGGLISFTGSFPYMAEEGIEIKPGHHNIISLNALRVDADDSMRSLDPISRNCRFYDEASSLKIYKNYTYSNCLFECGILKAYEVHKCIPWYFPFYDDTFQICNPWVTKEFLDYMSSTTSESCIECLPECSSTMFDSSITTIPFSRCDYTNKEMSLFCNFSSYMSKPLPKKYISQLRATEVTPPPEPQSIFTNCQKNIRSYDPSNKIFFINNPTIYDAFDTDIATVDIYFRKSSVLQMGRQSKMSWIDYLANVGGLLGLVLGMGFVSFIELVWFSVRVLARSFHLTRWII